MLFRSVMDQERFVSEDGRILRTECSQGVAPADSDVLGKLEIVQAIREEFGFNITNNPEEVQELNVYTEPNTLTYDFKYKGVRYEFCYLKNLREVEISIIQGTK